ncbi:DUF881 domain-containing protein [Gleimia hominis]|uniref:DUF881 domain-containing protein n=1 Tax=Gleimia hominis TaxID=595468 RepID=A0ABU3IDR0_9ACTO|nr:DUF881 domain-containing protein [Gleimia hominis]MDT3767632.1 DUF881 domain-containing protein [Gleimia hominis]
MAKRRLRDLLYTSISPTHVVIALLCLLLGFALVTQLKVRRSDPLEGLSEEELVTLLDQLGSSEEQLRSERGDLQAQLRRLESAQSQAEVARETAQKEQTVAEILSGRKPVEGPGIRMTIYPDEPLRATLFVTVLGELRNAGAEAIELNGNRINASSFITMRGGNIAVSGKELEPPYEWAVIGNADTIAPALEIAGGAASQLRGFGARVDITKVADLVIRSTVAPVDYEHAQVVP